MRRIDKKLNMMKANLLAESNYLKSKGLINESTNGMDEKYLSEMGLALDNRNNQKNEPKSEPSSNNIIRNRDTEIKDLASKYELKIHGRIEKGSGVSGPSQPERKYFNFEFYKEFNPEPSSYTRTFKVFGVNIVKGLSSDEDNVTTHGEKDLIKMIPDENQRNEFMKDMGDLIDSILDNELANDLKEESPLGNNFDFKTNPEKLNSMIENILQYFGTDKTGSAAIANDNKVMFITQLLQMSPPSTFLRDGENNAPTNNPNAMASFVKTFNR